MTVRPLSWTLLALLLASTARAEGIVYPANAGVFNVRDARYGAKGDGVTDDTIAIQKALSEGLYSHRIVYLPDGVYLVSDTLKWNNGQQNNASGWGGFLQMQGQSRDKTILRLNDDAPGFDDEAKPKAVIATGSGAGHGNKHYVGGEGNEAFENHLRDFTVEIGKGNPGAVGIDFQASNCGAMRHISIKGDGFCGLSLMRRENGPGLIKDVSIDGFRFGVRAQQELCHFIFEDLTLANQSEVGMSMRDAIFGIRHLSSQNQVPALQISGIALVNLFDSELKGAGTASAASAAIEVNGSSPRLFVRGLKTQGYKGSIKARGEFITDAAVDEWSSDDAVGPRGANARSLNLPIRDTPVFYDPNTQNWADAGAPSGHDDTAQIQTALNSGKATVYFHHGAYRVKDTLVVPRTIKLLLGIGTSLDVIDKLPNGRPLFLFEGGTAGDTTIVDRFTAGCKKGLLTEHADARTLVLQDLTLYDAVIYRNRAISGPLFIEDVTGSLRLDFPTQMWARQFDIEGFGTPRIVNNGGTAWILGWKSETGELLVENRNGGKLEIWAGLPYTFGVPKGSPAFVNDNASLVASFAGMTFMGGDNPFYDLIVRDTQGQATKDYRRRDLPGRGGAAFLPLFVSTTRPTGERKMKWTKIAATAVTAAATVLAAPQTTPAQTNAPDKSYQLPGFMDGEKNGSATGNPVGVGGQPMWRLDQVWPDDISQRASYKPLVWGGQNWIAPDQKFGTANAKIENGNLMLGLRSAWGGKGDEAGSKLTAMAFIAPAKGHYVASGTARADIWQGDDKVSLHILKNDGHKIIRLKVIPLPKNQDVNLEGVEADLEAGEELVMTAQIGAWYTGVNLEFKGLKVTSGKPPAAAAPIAANGDVNIGSIVTIGGHRFKVELAEGKIIVLRQQE